MRMWMVDPKIMCRAHLFGEHQELHQLAGAMDQKRSMTGYIEANLLEPMSMGARHDELVEEMKNRGYESGFNHQSPWRQPDISYLPKEEREAKIDVKAATKEIRSRCRRCGKDKRDDCWLDR